MHRVLELGLLANVDLLHRMLVLLRLHVLRLWWRLRGVILRLLRLNLGRLGVICLRVLCYYNSLVSPMSGQ